MSHLVYLINLLQLSLFYREICRVTRLIFSYVCLYIYLRFPNNQLETILTVTLFLSHSLVPVLVPLACSAVIMIPQVIKER